MRKNFYIFCLLFSSLFLQVNLSICNSENSEKIRVGICDDFEGYFRYDENGEIYGYDIEYLNKIAEYTGWQYEYIHCRTYSEALDKLSAKEIDILGVAQYSKKRDELYAFCNNSYGVTYAALVTTEGKNIDYQDYQEFSNLVIGYDVNYENGIAEYIQRHEISPQLKSYNNRAELRQALNCGEIDAMVINTNLMLDGEKLLDKYFANSYYFISYKGNEGVLRKIDDALLKIQLDDSEFQNNSLNMYFPVLTDSPYTKDELDYISKCFPLRVGCIVGMSPIAYVDEQTGEVRGMMIDFCEKIAENTGLVFKYIPLEVNQNPALEMQKQQLDMVAGIVNFGGIIFNSDLNLSKSIHDCEISLYGKIKMDFDPTAPMSVAILEEWSSSLEYIKNKYPTYSIRYYNTPRECLEAVNSGKVDLTLQNTYVAEAILKENDKLQLMMIPTTDVDVSLTIAFADKNNRLLSSIINKGRAKISEQDATQIVINQSLKNVQKITLKIFIKKYSTELSVLGCLVLLCLFILSIKIYRYKLEMKHAKILKIKNKELAQAGAKAEKANKAKSEFLSKMSHDIRTPLNAILGMNQIAQENLENKRTVSNCLYKSRLASEHLLELINDILDISKIENHKIELHFIDINLQALLDNIRNVYTDQSRERGISFTIECNRNEEIWFIGDKLRINQIIVNFLSNAMKFTPKGGKVIFKVEVTEKIDAVRLDFSIKDTGPGIKKENLKKIFQPFQQEENGRTSQYEGTGLGLSIAMNLANLMGGKISAKSKLGHGSEFIFSADFKISFRKGSEALPQKKRPIKAPDLTGQRILIVEDNEINMDIICSLLEKTNAEVDLAKNGKEAIDCILKSPIYWYKLILMDIRMPQMDGYTATKTIRNLARPDTKDITVCAMTADAFKENLEEILACGMDFYLLKPIDREKLYDFLESLKEK